MTKSLKGLILLCCLLAPLSAHSQENDWYQVELWVFTHLGSQALTSEFWDPSLQATSSPNAQRLQEGDPNAAFNLLPASAPPTQFAQQIESAPAYRLLFSGTWRQPIVARDQAQPVLIDGGERLADGLPELMGEIQLDRGRYLHLRTQLFLRRPLTWGTEVSLRPTVGNPSEVTEAEQSPINRYFTDLAGETGAGAPPEILTVTMQQARRMRSGELHYLDHPMFGVLIRLTPQGAPTSSP